MFIYKEHEGSLLFPAGGAMNPMLWTMNVITTTYVQWCSSRQTLSLFTATNWLKKSTGKNFYRHHFNISQEERRRK